MKVFRNILKLHPFLYDFWIHRINKLDQGTVNVALESFKANPSVKLKSKYNNILIFTQRYWKIHSAIEFLLARSLKNCGYNVTVLICDKAVNTCDNDVLEGKKIITHMCNHCAYLLKRFAGRFGLNLVSIRDYMLSNNLYPLVDKSDKLKLYEQYVVTSWRRLCRSINVISEDEYNLKDKLIESISVYDVFFNHYLKNTKFDHVVMLNGKFFAERLLVEHCKKFGIEYITYEMGQLKNSIITEKNNFVVPYRIESKFKYLIEEPLTNLEEKVIDGYMLSRENNLHPTNTVKISDYIDINLLTEKKVFSLFSNVIWDSAVIGQHTIFSNMYEWIEKTINIIKDQQDSILIIRTHPDEVKLSASQFATRERVSDFLSHIEIPPNVYVISSDLDINSYSIFKVTDVGLVYTSTVGLEMAYRGIPVVVCGNTHYGNQDFVYSPASFNEYEDLLINPLCSSDEKKLKAKKYSYILFCKYHMKLEGIERTKSGFKYTSNLNNLIELFGFN